ncbi:MAG TPA: GAF and ANTAR domain-containing protein [Jatrophihabitantaceae bacterium]
MSLGEIEEQPSSTPVIPQTRSAESPGFVISGPADTGELTVESIVRLLTLVRADLAAELDHDATPEELLDQVVHLATRLVPGADDAGIALVSDTGLRTCAAAGDAAVAADDIQRALGEGPSQQVIIDGQTLRIADLLTEPRWADFSAQAVQFGVRAVLACPLPMPRKRAGVLSLYSARPGAFDAAAELVVPVFAARAAIAAAYADKVTNLHRAIESRQVIGQATGILMERHRLSPKQAFDTMVTASQESHLKLREVALRINETGEEPRSAAAVDR